MSLRRRRRPPKLKLSARVATAIRELPKQDFRRIERVLGLLETGKPVGICRLEAAWCNGFQHVYEQTGDLQLIRILHDRVKRLASTAKGKPTLDRFIYESVPLKLAWAFERLNGRKKKCR